MLCSGLVLTVHDVRHILSYANPIHLVIDLLLFFTQIQILVLAINAIPSSRKGPLCALLLPLFGELLLIQGENVFFSFFLS